MLNHNDLVVEMASVEKMSTQERLKLAKKRRSQQLKLFASYEKQLEKEKHKKSKDKSGSQNQRKPHRKRARVRFIHNIMLLEAAARGDIEEVRKLLMAGVVPDVTNEDGLTALHQCCIDDSEEMLKLLLEFGANVNARDSEMWTPLHAAATCGHVHLCKLLVDKGAELLAVNADGNMPYDICEDEVCLDLIETEMAKRGITQEEIDETRLETERKMLNDLKKLAADGGNLEYRDRNRATPLHIAAANGYIDVVEFLMNKHVSLETRDEDGWLPIHAAACWLQPEVIEMLVKNGADIDAKTRTGETPFDLAEDPDVKQKILDIKDEMEHHRARTGSKDHARNRRTISTRGFYSSTSSIYSSNGSLNEKPAQNTYRSVNSSLKSSVNTNPSASIRRTSMRSNEKKPLFKKEAKEEALHFGMIGNDEDDEIAHIDDDENVPATNIDDVRISIVDEDVEKHQKEKSEKQKVDKIDSIKPQMKGSSPNTNKNRDSSVKDSHKPKEVIPDKLSQNRDPQIKRNSDNRDNRHSDTEKRKSNGHEPETIHIQMGRTDSSSKSSSRSPQSHENRDSRVVRDTDKPADNPERNSKPMAPNPQVKNLQSNVKRTPSFQKRSESQRRRSMEYLGPEPETEDGEGSGPRYPTGTPGGTLADLKKHRAEQHKFGSTEGMVANLFLHSLSGDTGKRYSSGGTSPPAPSMKDKAQNGRTNNSSTKANNNNNPPSGHQRPPTFISDSGPLRKFSAPTSHPIGHDEDKFKNDCCTIL